MNSEVSGRSGRSNKRRNVRTESHALITIDAIAAGGDGVGRLEGMVCFVPRTAPGDIAQVAYVTHARFARGRVLSIVEPSHTRTDPTCTHYVRDRCGGCQLQHMSQESQKHSRQVIVQDALARVGSRNVDLPQIVSASPWQYRTRLTLTLVRRGKRWVGGLHPFDDPARVFALHECPIAHDSLVDAWKELQPFLVDLHVSGTVRLELRLVQDGGAVSVAVDADERWNGAAEWASRVVSSRSNISSVWWRASGGEYEDVMAASEFAANDRAPSFTQVNPEVARLVRQYTVQQIIAFDPRYVVEGYAGSGLLALDLAMSSVRVTVIESDAAATAIAERRLADFGGCRVMTSTVEESLASALPADVVVLNPPRRGVDAAVTSLLTGNLSDGQTQEHEQTRAVVYVSCDPATLARDIARLPGWQIKSVRLFDMFPQTSHVETVCVLVPENQ